MINLKLTFKISGQNECANYNEGVLKNNLKFAISDAIKCPPAGFEDVVSVHFYLKKRQLIKVGTIFYYIFLIFFISYIFS